MKQTTTQSAHSDVPIAARVLRAARDGRKLERALGVVLWLALIAVLLGTGR